MPASHLKAPPAGTSEADFWEKWGIFRNQSGTFPNHKKRKQLLFFATLFFRFSTDRCCAQANAHENLSQHSLQLPSVGYSASTADIPGADRAHGQMAGQGGRTWQTYSMLHSDSGKFMIHSGWKQVSLMPCKGQEIFSPFYFVIYLWISRIEARLHHYKGFSTKVKQNLHRH